MSRILRCLVFALFIPTVALADIVPDDSQPPTMLMDKVCNGLLEANTPKAPPTRCTPGERPLSFAPNARITTVDGQAVIAGKTGFSGAVTTTCGTEAGKPAAITTVSGGNAGTIIVVGKTRWTLEQAFACKAIVTVKR